MAVNANILLQGRGLDLGPAVDTFFRARQLRMQEEQAPIQNQLLQAQVGQAQQQLQMQQMQQTIKDGAFLGSTLLGRLNAGDLQGAASFLNSQKSFMSEQSKPMIDEALSLLSSGRTEDIERLKALSKTAVEAAQGMGQFSSATAQPAEVRAFNEKIRMLEDPTIPEDTKKAIRIDLGLDPRAMGSAAQTIAEKGKTEVIAESREAIVEAERTGAERGARRQKDIGKISDAVAGIDRGLSNAKRAIEQIDKGAKTGRIQNLLPSINSATLELQQILGEETLNRLSQVTLGAISESELDLLKQVALPVGMDEKELKKYLERKSEALKKARKVAVEQLIFLRDGGTVEEFIISKAGQQPQQAQPNTVGRFKIIEVQ